MKHLVAVALLALSAAPAMAQPYSFEGKWARKPELCDATTPPTPERPAPITLARDGFDTPFLKCTFSSVLPGGVSWRVEAECLYDGKDKGHEFFTFAMLDNLMHWSWAGRTVTFYPCR